ncbi:MAG: O-antigen ligase family protein [Clostridia bacterium]|nr:O-antigen ligase family protein [Clostridia bacterium]MDD4375925.1 O-antigen ligase family protein [Clostridia bacterium]
MQKVLNKIYDEKIIKWFYILLPIVEVFTTYMVMNTKIPITIGMIYKTFFLLYCIVYLLFVDKKHKKYNYLLIGIFGISIVMNIIISINTLSFNILINKVIDISKYVCFPITMMFLYKYMLNGNKISLKTLVYSATIYATVMVIAKAFGTEISTYGSTSEYGHSGWYYSGNEISALFAMFFPIVIYFASKYGNALMIFSLVTLTYGLLAIGTKTSFVAIIITLISIIIFEMIMFFVKKTKLSKRMLFVTFLTTVVILASSPYSPSLKFISQRFETAKTTAEVNDIDPVERFIFNGREQYVSSQKESMKEATLKEKIFGLNDYRKAINEGGKPEVTERDVYDILFIYGAFGLIVYFLPMAIIVIIFLKSLFTNFSKECNEKKYVMGISILLSLGISYIAGHVLLAPTVAIFLSMIFAKLNEPEENEKQNLKMKKMIIYMPKLSTGGMEMALINFLNMSILRKKYNITLCLGYVEQKEFLKIIPSDIKVRLLCKGKWNTKGKTIASIKYIFEAIDSMISTYDISICYSYHHSILSELTRTASPNNMMFMHTDILTSRTEEEIKKIIKKVKFKKFKAIVCVSNAAKKSLEKVIPEYKGKMFVANNYINGENIIKLSKEKIEEKTSKDNEKIFINVSRHLEAAKKISRIIESSKILKEKKYKFKVWLIGDGEDSSLYTNMIKKYELENEVIMFGRKTNPYKYIKASDCLVVSSEFEGYGIVLDESRVLNKPIISTNVGDAKKILEDGYGIISEKSVKGMYESMKIFLEKGYSVKHEFNYNKFNSKIDKTLLNICKFCEGE